MLIGPNPAVFKNYYQENEKRQRDNFPEYKAAGLAVDSIPTLDSILSDKEEIIKGYEKEIRPLSPVPQKLKSDAISLGIEVNN